MTVHLGRNSRGESQSSILSLKKAREPVIFWVDENTLGPWTHTPTPKRMTQPLTALPRDTCVHTPVY